MVSADQREHDPLGDLEPYDASKYADLDLDRLTALGVRILTGRGLPVTFENVVVTLFRLFPEKFALIGYRDYPDAARVNRALLHCLPKYRNYLTGRARTGYRLTHQGEVAAEEAAELLTADNQDRPRSRGRAAPRAVADQFMREVADSSAYNAYVQGDQDRIRMYDIARLLHTSTDAQRELLRRNLRQLEAYARQTDRKDISAFLAWAAERFDL